LNDGNADPICRQALRITKIGFEAIDAPDEAVAAPTETSRHDAGCLAFAAQDNSENLSVGSRNRWSRNSGSSACSASMMQ
jgi:hypothetical protein